MNLRRLLPLVVGVATAAVAGVQAVTIASPRTGFAAVPVPGGGETVTLLSGDLVHVGAAGTVSIRMEPGPGRSRVRFVVERVKDHLFVVPADAFRLVGAGRVDRRLFDVTALLAGGVDDARRDHLPLVVHNASVRLPKRDAGRFWADLVRGTASVRWDQPASTAGVVAGRAGGDVTLALRLLGRDGMPAPDHFVTIRGYDGGETIYPYDPSGTVKVSVPPGRYVIRSSIYSAADGSTSLLVQPWVELRRDTTFTVDAQVAEPVKVTVPHPTATTMVGVVMSYAMTANGLSQEADLGATFDSLYVGQFGPSAPPGRFVATVTGHFADATHAFFADSPYRYNVAFAQRGRMFDGLRRHVTYGELATVTNLYSTDGPPGFVDTHSVTSAPVGVTPQFMISYGIEMHRGINRSRTEYFGGDGVRWMQDTGRGNPVTQEWEGSEVSPWQRFSAGRTYRLRWGSAVIGPGFFHDEQLVAATRSGDMMSLNVPLFSPGIAGFSGASVVAEARTVLSRDGTVIGETSIVGQGRFVVPADTGVYRLDMHALRPQYEFSPTLDTTWTFRSGPVPVDRVDPLPLMVLRFNPELDDRNRAPAGAAFDLPMWVEGQQTSTVPAMVRVSLAVSYDDGAHWQDAVLTPTRSGWVASLTHPAAGSGTGYVSLHATAADGTGGSVTQTIIHAYGLASTRDLG